jgi:hypothetical protein
MADFVKQFDCKNVKHVIWLKELGSSMARSIGGGKSDISKMIKENPLPGKPSMDNVMDFAYVHFQLCMKYTNAVLNGEAYVPNQK